MNKIYLITLTLVGITVMLIAGAFLLNRESRSFSISYQRTPELGEAIIVSFEELLSQEEALSAFYIKPAIKGELQWLEEYGELHFLPEEGFDPDISYTINIQNITSTLASLQIIRKFSFQPEGLSTKVHVRIPGTETIYYITESGLKRSLPSMEVFNSYPNNKEESIKIIDEQTLALYPDGVLIHLENNPDVYKLENGNKRIIKNSYTFNTLGLDWNAIAPVNYIEFSAYPTGDPITMEALPSLGVAVGKFMEVNLDEMKLKLWEDGQVVDVFDIVGKGNPRTAPTRKGFFSVLSKESNHFSSLSRVWMPWSIRYSGGYFIHEWPYWPGGKKITSKYSAGCIRLNEGDSQIVYDWVDIGTPILVR